TINDFLCHLPCTVFILPSKLTSVPEFKNKKQVTIQSVKTNAQTPHEMTDEEEYRKRKYGKNKYFRG
ncbi:MAG: hypothetical protein ACLSVX_13770, partial [Massilimicrobiota timonensis]